MSGNDNSPLAQGEEGITSWRESLKGGHTRTLSVYSNRPPTSGLAGGAVRVIAASDPHIWLGPGETVPDAEWEKMSDEEKYRLTKHEISDRPDLEVYTFKVPAHLQHLHYNQFANGFLWPLLHSMDPSTFFNPEHKQITTAEDYYRNTFLFSSEWIQEAYDGYKQFNALANRAIDTLKGNGDIRPTDVLWIHDYQCLDVQGDAFSRHIPFPSIDYLKTVYFSDDVNVLETPFIANYVRHIAEHGVISFQRPVDLKNFIEAAAIVDPAFTTKNPGMIDADGRYTKSVKDIAIGKESLTPIEVFGKKTKLLTVPVGISQSENLQEAKENEKRMDITRLDSDRLRLSGMAPELPDTPIFTDRNYENDGMNLKQVLGKMLSEDDHRIFVALHRNDYTKNTMEKLDAAERFLTEHPEEVGHTHFVYILQPTRQGVTGYQAYEDSVLKKAKELHDKFGDSVAVIPQGVDHGDIMALLRHRNVVSLLAVGLKDGHDLTTREAVDARADRAQEPVETRRPPISLIMTDGIGAADILGGTEEKPGAFVIDTSNQKPCDQSVYLSEQLAKHFAKVVELNKTPEGLAELEQRYDVMAEASAKYSAKNFGDVVLSAAVRNKELEESRSGGWSQQAG